MDPQFAHDQFVHIRIIIGIVTSLSVTRLLTGLARFVQHPVRDRIYLVHLAWALFLLLAIVHFWWFEFGLERIAGLVNTAIKGAEHFGAFGIGYPVRQGVLAALALVAMFVADRRYHGAPSPPSRLPRKSIGSQSQFTVLK